MAVRMAIARELRLHLWDDLLQQDPDLETAGFLYASSRAEGASVVFEARHWYLVPDDGYARRTDRYLELKDEIRGDVIQRAHTTGLTLVEFHSHLEPAPAAFSFSDHAGFSDFVPYVRWRLKGRPYLAVVVAESGFDGLAWLGSSKQPCLLDGIDEEGEFIESTGISFRSLENHHE